MDSTTTILNDYRDNLEIYQGLRDDIEDIINRILKQNQIKISNLAIRIKSEKSLTKKIQFKKKYHHASDITDVVACRIITLFEDDVEKLKHLISQNFEVVEIVDKRKKENTLREEYGYNSLHMIVKFTDARCELVEYAPYKDIAFEIQIRTAMQHAWCEIEHGLGYKSAYEIPKQIRRRLDRLSATIEILDEEFVSIAKEVEEYNKGLEHEEKIMKTDINLLSLQKYVLHQPMLQNLMKDLAKHYDKELEYDVGLLSQFRLVQRLNYMGFGYIHELDELITKQEQQIRFVASTWMEFVLRNKKTLNYYLCLIWIVINSMLLDGNEEVKELMNKDVFEKISKNVLNSEQPLLIEWDN